MKKQALFAVAAAALLAAAPPDAPAQDLGRALGIFNSIVRPAAPAAPVAAPGNPLGNLLGRWIGLQSSRPQLSWTFAVLDDPGFNAFAAPGGYVFVTKGLVDRVDEAELAGILAHEINHVTERHHLQALRTKARAGLATQALASQLNNNLGGAVSAQLLALGRDLYSSGLDQDDEFQADRLGVVLAARAGLDPYGLPSVLQQLRTAAPDNPLFSLSLRTHPAPQVRLDRLEDAMASRLDGFSGQPRVPLSQRLADRR